MTATQQSRSAGGRARLFVRRVHLWLGLGLGALFALLGLTGSALVFYTGIDAALHPAMQVGRGADVGIKTPFSLDRALATGRARWQDPGGKWTFELTGDGGAIPARYYPTPGHHAERQMVWFSPDGVRILRAEPWGGYMMSWIYQLHMQLLAGEVGHQVVGWSGIAMLVLLASGIMAWWPRGRWRKALAFKRNAAPIRRLRDLHKLSGLWSAVLLFILTATGVLLALPAVTEAVFAPSPVPAPTSIEAGDRPITIARALAVAQRALPDGRPVFIDMPSAPTAPIRVRFQVPGDPHGRFPSSYVFVDRGSGRVLATYDIRRANLGARALSWVRALHDGSIAGLPTRILVTVAGILPALLLTTGIMHWRRRQTGKRRSAPT